MRCWLPMLFIVGLALAPDARVLAQSPGPSAAPAQGAAPPNASQTSAEPLDFTGEITAAPPPAPAPAPPVDNAPTAASAEKLRAAAAPALRPNSINLSVLGFVIGAVRLTYERMILPKHGLFGEAIVMPDILRGFEYVGVGGAVGYRFHWHGAETSAFVGGTLSVTRASGTTPTFKLGDDEFPEFRGSAWTLGIAPHVGKRWLFARSGINLTLRIGGGLAIHVVDAWRGSEPGAKRNLQRSFAMTDGELSLGYSF